MGFVKYRVSPNAYYSKWGPWPYDVFFSWAWWGGGMVISWWVVVVVVVDGPPRLPEAPRGCPRLPRNVKNDATLKRFCYLRVKNDAFLKRNWYPKFKNDTTLKRFGVKTMPLSSVFAVENSKTMPLSSKIDVPTGHFLEKQNTLKRNLIFPGHFPHGRFRAVDSPRFPRGSPKTVINEGFMHVFNKKMHFG